MFIVTVIIVRCGEISKVIKDIEITLGMLMAPIPKTQRIRKEARIDPLCFGESIVVEIPASLQMKSLRFCHSRRSFDICFLVS